MKNSTIHYIAESSELGMGLKLDDKILQYLLLAKCPAQTMFNMINDVMPVASFRYHYSKFNYKPSTHVSLNHIVTEDKTSELTIGQMLLRQKMENRIIVFYHPVSPHI